MKSVSITEVRWHAFSLWYSDESHHAYIILDPAPVYSNVNNIIWAGNDYETHTTWSKSAFYFLVHISKHKHIGLHVHDDISVYRPVPALWCHTNRYSLIKPWGIAAPTSFKFTIHFYTTEASLRQARAIEMHHRTAGGGSPQDTCCLTFFKGFVSRSRHLCSFFYTTFLLCKTVKKSGTVSAPQCRPISTVLLDKIRRSELHGNQMNKWQRACIFTRAANDSDMVCWFWGILPLSCSS